MAPPPGVLVAEPKVASAQGVLQRLCKEDGKTCGLIRGLASSTLMSLSKNLCNLVDEACEVNLWEGNGALEGESVEKQFERQLSECVNDELNVGDSWLPHAMDFVRELLAMYPRDIVPDSEGNFYYLKLQINIPDACVKFHDDFVGVRAVTALCGEATVVAPDPNVNWKHWEETEGRLPESVMGATKEEYIVTVKTFNETLCNPPDEFHPAMGDVLLMKGGALAGNRPCIHRAPYSADVEFVDRDPSEQRRLLITLDLMSGQARDEMIEMRADNGSDNYDSTNEDENEK